MSISIGCLNSVFGSSHSATSATKREPLGGSHYLTHNVSDRQAPVKRTPCYSYFTSLSVKLHNVQLIPHRANSGTIKHQCHSTDRLWHPGVLGARPSAQCQRHPQRIRGDEWHKYTSWYLSNRTDWNWQTVKTQLSLYCKKEVKQYSEI